MLAFPLSLADSSSRTVSLTCSHSAFVTGWRGTCTALLSALSLYRCYLDLNMLETIRMQTLHTVIISCASCLQHTTIVPLQQELHVPRCTQHTTAAATMVAAAVTNVGIEVQMHQAWHTVSSLQLASSMQWNMILLNRARADLIKQVCCACYKCFPKATKANTHLLQMGS